MLYVPHPVMLVTGLFLTTSIFCLADSVETGQRDTAGTCQSLSDDCIDGYTSLLQESLKVVGHQRDRASASAKLVAAKLHSHTSQEAVKTEGVERRRTSKIGSSKTRWDHGLLPGEDYAWIVGALVLLLALFWFQCLRPAMMIHRSRLESPRGNDRRTTATLAWVVNDPDNTDDLEPRIHDTMEDDTFSLAIALMVRDLRSLAMGDHQAKGLKYSRLSYAVGLVLVTLVVQISVVVCTKQFVTPLQVSDIRDAYEKYEITMYMNHTVPNVNGKARGIDGYFNASMFATLEDDDKTDICNIPFSQLHFFVLILMIWCITCVADLKKCFETFLSLVVFCDTVDDMKSSMTHWEDLKIEDDDQSKESSEGTGLADAKKIPIMVITGLTVKVKVFFTFCIFLPEFLCTTYILWLGCRWLTATNDWGNIVSNAVALEFTLQLKSLLYYAMASERNKRDLGFTGVAPPWPKEAAGLGTYFNTVLYLLLCAVWIYMYIFHFQQVLPDYKWDVHEVCNPWLVNILKDSGGDD